jgi:hypothetical protein
VRVDASGALVLRLDRTDDGWRGAQLRTTTRHGLGRYALRVREGLAGLPPSAVAGFFVYGGRDFADEIDVEISRWGDPDSAAITYAIWPTEPSPEPDPEMTARRASPRALRDVTTHGFEWSDGVVQFRSVEGLVSAQALFADGEPFARWRYEAHERRHGQIPRGPLPLYLNLWVHRTARMDDLQSLEIVLDGVDVPAAVR